MRADAVWREGWNLIITMAIQSHHKEKRIWSYQEVAAIIGVHPRTILNEINRGKLKSGRAGIKHIITLPDLVAYLGEERAQALFGEGG